MSLSKSILACAAALCVSAAAAAQYPAKPVRIIVPFAPGGAVDTIARIVADKISGPLGQSVYVENRTGAGSMVGTEAVVRSAPDGYTLLLGTASALLINPLLQDLPYDPMKDLVPVAEVGVVPYLLVANPGVPATDLQSFIAHAKANPGKLSYASAGAGTPHHISGEMFKQMAGIDMVHVPYRGSGPALIDLVSGEVAVMTVEILAALPYVQSGKLRALGIATAERSSLAPDIPTVAQAGLPGFEFTAWYGVVAPAGVPREVIDRLSKVINQAMAEPDARQRLAAIGVTPQGGTPEQFAALMKSESLKWQKAVKDAKVTLK